MTIPKHEPEPAYRWVIVIASGVMLAVAAGVIVNGISVFLIPLSEEFGWKRGAVSLINTAGLAGVAIGGIVMGRIADRTETRGVSLIGTFALGLCILAVAWADALWQFYLLFFVAGFLGAGSLMVPLVANVGNWFKSGVGLALGIASAGQALGQGGVPFGTAVLIGAIGWRDALTVLGVLIFLILIPLALLIRQPPGQSEETTSEASAEADEMPVPLPSNAVVTWLSIAVVFCCICMSTPLMHLVPLIQDRGIPLEDAGSVMFVMLIAAVLGRLAFGKLADMISAIKAYMIASFWQTALVFLFIQIESVEIFYLFAFIFGFGYSGVMTGVLVCVRVLTPLSKRASALGIVFLFGWVGHGIGGYQGGYFFDLTGGYTLAYANAALAGIINLVIVAALYATIAKRKASPAFAG